MDGQESETPLGEVETLRQKAMESVRALRRENTPRTSDPSWVSYTGYNYGRWAARGFGIALGLLEDTPPRDGEAGPDYLRRVIELVRAERDACRADAEDEDGACSGALDAAMWSIISTLPEERDPHGLDASAEWELWYVDVFDREMPPVLEASGRGIVEGLVALWEHTLDEGIVDDGNASFSRFGLSWGKTHLETASVYVTPFDNHTLAKLRRWVVHASDPEQRPALLGQLAQLHLQLLRRSDRWTVRALINNEESEQLLSCVEPMDHPDQLLELKDPE